MRAPRFFLSPMRPQSPQTIFLRAAYLRFQIVSLVLPVVLLFCSVFLCPLGAESDHEIDYARLKRDLQSLVPALLREHRIAGVSLVVFSNDREVALSFGQADADGLAPVQSTTRFQAADLVRPITAALVLEQSDGLISGPVVTQPDLPRLERSITLEHLLCMNAGLRASRDGILPDQAPQPDRAAYLEERVIMDASPGSAYAPSPESYAFLGAWLETRANGGFEDIAARFFRRRSMQFSSVTRSEENVAVGLEAAGARFFPAPQTHLLYPAADSLWTTAEDYMLFLRWLYRESRRSASPWRVMLDAQFGPRLAPELGGMGAGFQVLRPAKITGFAAPGVDHFFRIEGRQPGYSSVAGITPDGRGAVVLANTQDSAFLRRLNRFLFERLDMTAPPPTSPISEETRRSFLALDLDRMEGSFRSVRATPASSGWFGFLNDLRLRVDPEGRLELGGVFEKETVIHLYPIGPDLFIARGDAAMENWRVKLRRDSDGNVVGLDTDLVRYDRTPMYLSAWAYIVYAGLLVASPVFVLLVYMIRRRPREEENE